MRRLLQPKNVMVSTAARDRNITHCYVSILNIIQGEVDPSEVSYSLVCFDSFHWIHRSLKLGSQEFDAYSWTETSRFYSLGSGFDPSRTVEKITLCYHPTSCEWTDAGQSYGYFIGELVEWWDRERKREVGVSFQLFDRICEHYDKLIKREAFVENFRRLPMFKDNLDEFNDSREVGRRRTEWKQCSLPSS